MKDFSKEKKESLFKLAESVVNKLHLQGVQPAPVQIECDLIFLDDKHTMKFPPGSVYQFQYGIFILFDQLNFPHMMWTISSLGGVINTTIPCVTPRSQRNHYLFQNFSPKTTLVTLVIFSKKLGNHVPWIMELAQRKGELVLPLTVCIDLFF